MELFVVTDNIVQNEYTEPRYYEQAIDATYIVGIYSTREQAVKEVERLEKLRDDSGDPDMIDRHYYGVQTFNLNENYSVR